MYQIIYQPYLDTINKCYKKGFRISPQPNQIDAPKLYAISKQKSLKPPSIFSQYNECDCNNTCVWFLINPNTKMPYTECESSEIINYFSNNGIKIDYDLTKIMMKQIPKLFLIVSEN